MRKLAAGVLFTLSFAIPAHAAIREEPVTYRDGGTEMKGFLVYDDAVKDKRPGIVVVHEWWGITKHVHGEARKLAEQGYARTPLTTHNVADPVSSSGQVSYLAPAGSGGWWRSSART